MDQELDAACASDFLNHYLFREFLQGIGFLLSQEGVRLRDWLGIRQENLQAKTLIESMSKWESWFGYYADCDSLEALREKCEQRLSIWRSFLNANIDQIPADIWKSKSSLGEPLHAMGNVLNEMGPRSRRLPLFVVIDQYEVLPELNPSHGTTLQRVVNTLIKARDPVVFYKIGARTYDWGKELRIWGAESRIEVQRDYVLINLADVLMRNEDAGGWLFPDVARDVAYRRMKEEGHYKVNKDKIKEVFGRWSPDEESCRYFNNKLRRFIIIKQIKTISDPFKRRIESICGPDASPLDLRLASAWVLQQQQRSVPQQRILQELKEGRWRKSWSWRKERVPVSLLQIAALANQKKLYYGWKTILYLSGGNISAFLLLCGEIWDIATKRDMHPLKEYPLSSLVQTEGIYLASEKWRNRDRNEQVGGRKRYEVLSRLGSMIRHVLIGDLALSNPGHSGFSLRETELSNDDEGKKVAEFLQNAVSWAIFEERTHTSKLRESTTRRKWYLHPLLSPVFAIPYIRAKEPMYVKIEDVHNWIYGQGKTELREEKIKSVERELPEQLTIPFSKQ